MANAANLINFGTGGAAVGDVVYSAYPLTAPSYLPLNNDTASYLTSSYPLIGAIYAPTTVAYSETTVTIPCMSVGSGVPFFNFVFGNKMFLGWSANGNIITSYDTVTWVTSAINTDYIQKATNTSANGGQEVAAIPSALPWKGMAYGNGRFVAIRNAPVFQTGSGSGYSTSSVGATAVSADNGQTWVQGTLPQQNTLRRTYWQSIGFGNGRFVASGYTDYDGTNFRVMLATSTDGVEWSTPAAYVVPAPTYNGALEQSNIAFGAGVYVALSLENATTNTVAWYTSGTYPLQWNISAGLPTGQKWKSVAYGAGVFVAVGSAFNDGATTAAATSSDGITWTSRTLPASLAWSSVTYANGYFMAVANTSPAAAGAVATSPNGITWTLRNVASVQARGAPAGGNGKFVFEQTLPAAAGASVISLDTAASTFTLPIVAPIKGVTPYMKAT